ncbi:MAG: hypothetical protein Udaeo2_02460 [Candidatus Udaeobacter sp.]|nr:MAG: hypothetical protein Udaeo2_02460 [Candidatus Udaeobacter sp.]
MRDQMRKFSWYWFFGFALTRVFFEAAVKRWGSDGACVALLIQPDCRCSFDLKHIAFHCYATS